MAVNYDQIPIRRVIGEQITVKSVTIPTGASVSNAVDFGVQRLAGIILPSAWTFADMSFSASPDASAFYNLFDGSVERLIASTDMGPSRLLALPYVEWIMVRSLMVRSGTSALPVNQASARTIQLITV